MRTFGIPLLVGAAAGLPAALQPTSDSDLFWHLATAREAVSHGLVRVDPFSWTARGQPIPVDQWLGQLVLYGAYLAGDFRGIAILRVILVATLVALVTLNAGLRGARPLAAVVAALPALLLTRAVWVDRPELLGLVCFAALLPLLHLARDGGTRSLGACVVLVALWANIHGSFALGAVLVVLVCAEGIVRDRTRARVYVAAIAATALATLLTPAGLGTWTAPGSHLLSPPRYIEEWTLIDLRTPLGATYAATLALVVTSALLGPRLAARELVVLLPVAFLSLTAARQAPLLAVAAAPMLALSAERAFLALADRRARGARSAALGPPRAQRPLGALSLVPPALLLLVAFAITPAQVDEHAYPVEALPALPAGDGVLARYEWGGWLIWRAPRTPVFVDGRLVPYLASGIIDDYRRIIAAEAGWQDIVTRRGVRTLLVSPRDPVAVRARELGWNEFATTTFDLITVP